MKFLATRSVPLAKDTRDAWKLHGVRFARRDRSDISVRNIVITQNYQALINLGNVDRDFSNWPVDVWNPPDLIKSISTATALRRTLGDFLPPHNIVGPHWHKRNGFGGKGKVFHDHARGECPIMGGDVQAHVDGVEYRIITVGDLVVQASRKLGTFPHFTYEWVGVEGIAQGGFIPFLKEAVSTIKGYERAIIGWDVIHDGNQPFIIEGNTSPGVNDATAGRIINQVKETL